jgi:hypothetical protein
LLLKVLRNKKIKERSYFWIFMLDQDTHLGSTKLLPDIVLKVLRNKKIKERSYFWIFMLDQDTLLGSTKLVPSYLQ